jgi:hypothetical protein
MRRLAGALALVALSASVAAAAGGPAAALEHAFQRSSALRSERMALTERVAVGGKTVTRVTISGVQQPQARTGSLAYSASPGQAGLDHAKMLVFGSDVYVHYPIFDVMQLTNPAVKTWLLVNTHSSLGVDPTGLASLGTTEVRELSGLRAVGTGVDSGVPVTSYRGKLALSKIAKSKQIQGLLASLPSATAAILAGTETVVVAVGKDGLVHHVDAVITTPPIQGSRLTITIDVEFTQFNRSPGAVRAPPASLVMSLAQWQLVNGNGASAANAILLEKVALRGAQVGRGYELSQIPGGKLVQGETTLDFCNLSYRSEALRTARLQVAYLAKGAATKLSNEIVTYHAGGAQQALQEMKQAAATCPNGRVANPPSGIEALTRTTRVIHDPHLPPGSVVIAETDSAVVKGKHVTVKTVAVYQARGDVLSGVYGYGSSLAAVERLTLHAAEQSAANLRQHVSTATGLPIA